MRPRKTSFAKLAEATSGFAEEEGKFFLKPRGMHPLKIILHALDKIID